ncbi:hypothetical protein Lal_00027950 [Lupinus albus]|nr:hypothetical protein Lal_00027950 [Lupinus albus]
MCWWWCRLSDCGKWCDIYRRFSLLVVIPVRYNFGDGLIVSKSCLNEIVLESRVEMRLASIDMGSGVPHSLKFESVIEILNSWKPRLIERFSPERKRISWEGEILDYTRGFSPGREMAILGC